MSHIDPGDEPPGTGGGIKPAAEASKQPTVQQEIKPPTEAGISGDQPPVGGDGEGGDSTAGNGNPPVILGGGG